LLDDIYQLFCRPQPPAGEIDLSLLLYSKLSLPLLEKKAKVFVGARDFCDRIVAI